MVFERNLLETLEAFTVDSQMDYLILFDQIKSVLEHCNKNVKPFSKLYFRSGNDAFINELCQLLQIVFVNENLVDAETKAPLPGEAEPTLRKVLLFLLANTDCIYNYNLRDDTQLVHLIGVCPLMPKFVVVAIIWDLQLDNYFYEMLSYTPCWFSFQYFEVAVESLKYVDDPYVVLDKVEHLMRSLLISIARCNSRQIDVCDQKTICGKLEACAMNLLRRFYTPDAEKFQRFTKNDFSRYSGFAVKHQLQMLLSAFDLYECAAKAQPLINIDMYEICLDTCKRTGGGGSAKALETLQDAQLKIVMTLLNTLQYNVMLVTIDVFIYWAEVDFPSGVNMQKSIGELAYHVGERIEKNARLAHDVQSLLKAIALRPQTLAERITDAKIGEILRSLDDEPMEPHVKLTWFSELFNRMDALCNSECLEAMEENVTLMTRQHCEQAIQFLKLENERLQQQQMEANTAEFEDLCALLRLALRNLSTPDMLQLLKYKENLFGDDVLFSAAGDDLAQRTTQYFNKSLATFELQPFLWLCFEDPTQSWRSMFEAACLNPKRIQQFCKIVQQSRTYADFYYRRYLNETICNAEQLQPKYFPHLLSEIYHTLYYPQHNMDFLKEFMNENVNRLLDTQAFDALLSVVRALNLIAGRDETQSYRPLNFGDVTAPVLVLVGRIMDKGRWDLLTYTELRDELVRECIQFIQHNAKKFLPVASDKDRKWICRVVKDSYRPLTQYYYQKFAQTPEQKAIEFDCFLMERAGDEHTMTAEVFLIKHYVRCTMKETEWLAQSDRLLPVISDVMLLLGNIVADSNTANAISNYRHCLVSFANIVKKFIMPPLVGTDDQKQFDLLMKLLRIIALVPSEIYNEIFMTFEGILMDLCLQFESGPGDRTIKMVNAHLDTMKECNAKVIFLRKFNALPSM